MRVLVFALAALVHLAVVGRPAEAQQSPADSLVGQQIETCKADLRFNISVAEAQLRADVAGRRPSRPGAAWVVAIVDVTNNGQRADSVQGLALLKDDRNRNADWRLFNGADIVVENKLAEELGITAAWELVEPGQTIRIAAVFEVPEGVRSLRLLPNKISCR